jgi:hypothetical protein
MRISSVMPRFSPDYELVLESTDGRLLDGATLLGGSGATATTASTTTASARRPPASPQHRARTSLALSVTAFFRSDGTLDKEAVNAAAARAGAELESRRKTS